MSTVTFTVDFHDIVKTHDKYKLDLWVQPLIEYGIIILEHSPGNCQSYLLKGQIMTATTATYTTYLHITSRVAGWRSAASAFGKGKETPIASKELHRESGKQHKTCELDSLHCRNTKLCKVDMDEQIEESFSDIQTQAREPWYKYITVEPTMFLYMVAFMVTNVVEQTFYVFRACTVDHEYSEEICYNIANYSDINKEVQKTVSNFHQWNGVASHIVPLCLAFFLGSYSDKRGRKSIMLAGLLGKLYFSVMITVNTLQVWPLCYVIYTATFPSALTGADLAIFAGCFAYIADVTSADNRTLRVGILDAVYLSTMPLGVYIGNLLYVNVVNRSFTIMFAINASLMLLATLHCFFFLKWQTRPEQLSLRDAGVVNPITDFFKINNIKQTMHTLLKRRSNHRTLFLWFLLISMALYTFQRDERPYMYLYVQNVFKWDSTTYSNFRTYQSTSYVITMFIGIPLMTKLFRLKDTVIVMIGAAAHIAGHLLYAQATDNKTMYVGATAAALGPCVAPLVRSMTSKILPTAERGVAYAFLSVMENAVAMFASIIYSQLYNATLGTSLVNAIFYLTIYTQAIVFLFALCMEIMLKGRRLETTLPEEEKEISEIDSTPNLQS